MYPSMKRPEGFKSWISGNKRVNLFNVNAELKGAVAGVLKIQKMTELGGALFDC
jgi:hypothetical protein